MLLVADGFIIITFCFRRRKKATNAPMTPNTPASTPTIIKSLWDFFFLIAGRWAGGRAIGETGGGWAGGGWAWGGGTGGGWAWGGRIAGEPVGGLSPLLNGEGGGKRKSKEDSGEDNGGGGEGNGGGGEAFPNPGSWPGGASWSSLRPLDVKGNGWPKLLSHKSKTSSSCKSATSLGTSPENELFLRILHNKKGNCLYLCLLRIVWRVLVIRLLTEISSELGFRVQVQVFLEGRDLLDFYVYIIRNQFIEKKNWERWITLGLCSCLTYKTTTLPSCEQTTPDQEQWGSSPQFIRAPNGSLSILPLNFIRANAAKHHSNIPIHQLLNRLRERWKQKVPSVLKQSPNVRLWGRKKRRKMMESKLHRWSERILCRCWSCSSLLPEAKTNQWLLLFISPTFFTFFCLLTCYFWVTITSCSQYTSARC